MIGLNWMRAGKSIWQIASIGFSFRQKKIMNMPVFCLKKIGDATVELEVIKEIWGEENLCQIYIMSLI